MNYYNEIKQELLNNEINRKVKNYSINKSDLSTYYNVGKLLLEAGNTYGESIIENYANKLMNEVGKKYDRSTLFKIRKFYAVFSNEKVAPLVPQLSWSHCLILLPIEDINKINYYIHQIEINHYTKRQLQYAIKNHEYERLDENTKNKLIVKDASTVVDFVKNPILIRNIHKYNEISEKILQKLILEDISSFMKELGNNFSFIDSEYKIYVDGRYNYIDLLLFNIEFNSYVVVELKVTELKKEHIGQIQVYMNYIDNNLRKISQDKTIGIIICKKENKYVIDYCSDDRIIAREYELVL